MQERILILMIPAFAILGCSTSNPTKELRSESATKPVVVEKKGERQLPTTVKEAVARILGDMTDEDKETVRNTKENDLIMFHHGWGTGIRNSLGLWGRNDALLKDAGKTHPDDVSMIIIRAVWQALQKQK